MAAKKKTRRSVADRRADSNKRREEASKKRHDARLSALRDKVKAAKSPEQKAFAERRLKGYQASLDRKAERANAKAKRKAEKRSRRGGMTTKPDAGSESAVADMSAAEAKTAISTMDASELEAAATAETEGKDRSTVHAAIEARKAELTD